MILADKIIELRKKNGWSQEQLAEQMDISRQSVSKWESGMSIPDLDKIIKMSNLFGVSTDYLLKDEIEEMQPGEETRDSMEEEVRRISVEEAIEAGFDEVLEDENSVIFIEWSENIKPLLPSKTISVYIKYVNENTREVEIVNE